MAAPLPRVQDSSWPAHVAAEMGRPAGRVRRAGRQGRALAPGPCAKQHRAWALAPECPPAQAARHRCRGRAARAAIRCRPMGPRGQPCMLGSRYAQASCGQGRRLGPKERALAGIPQGASVTRGFPLSSSEQLQTPGQGRAGQGVGTSARCSKPPRSQLSSPGSFLVTSGSQNREPGMSCDGARPGQHRGGAWQRCCRELPSLARQRGKGGLLPISAAGCAALPSRDSRPRASTLRLLPQQSNTREGGSFAG